MPSFEGSCSVLKVWLFTRSPFFLTLPNFQVKVIVLILQDCDEKSTKIIYVKCSANKACWEFSNVLSSPIPTPFSSGLRKFRHSFNRPASVHWKIEMQR